MYLAPESTPNEGAGLPKPGEVEKVNGIFNDRSSIFPIPGKSSFLIEAGTTGQSSNP